MQNQNNPEVSTLDLKLIFRKKPWKCAMISAILALQKRSKFFPDKFILTCVGFNFP